MTLPFHDPLRAGEAPTVAVHLRPQAPWPPLADQSDVLADPADELIAQSLYALLPSGPAWRTPDNAAFDEQSNLGGFLRGLAGDMATLYRRLFATGQESTASTLDASLADWEHEFGLPDPCMGELPSRTMRLRFLLAKVRSTGTITPGDFIALAEELGYAITIEEPLPFQCGGSELGAFDEVSGDAETAVEFHWIVRVANVPVIYFECGVSACDVDALTDFGFPQDLVCLFNALKPAWTKAVFSVD
jgi:uncharacterized protein YmfQ (DUF2313 family)